MKTKHILLLLLTSVLGLNLISCSKDDNEDDIDTTIQPSSQTYEQQLELINGVWKLQEIALTEIESDSKDTDELVKNFVRRQNENIKLGLDPYFNLNMTVEPYKGGYDDYNYLKSKDKFFFKGEISTFKLDQNYLIVNHLESVSDLSIFVIQDAKNNDDKISDNFKIQKAVITYKYIR